MLDFFATVVVTFNKPFYSTDKYVHLYKLISKRNWFTCEICMLRQKLTIPVELYFILKIFSSYMF